MLTWTVMLTAAALSLDLSQSAPKVTLKNIIFPLKAARGHDIKLFGVI